MALGESLPLPSKREHNGVTLRVLRRSDATPLRELLNENRAYLEPWEATHPSGSTVTPGSVPLHGYLRALRAQRRRGEGIGFAILRDGELAGQLSVSEVSGGALCSSQIGYWVAESHANRGVATAAVALVIDYLFQDAHLHRVEICIRPGNKASLRVVEKLGLRHEGSRARYIHIDGAWRDHEAYAITSEEVRGSITDRLQR